MKHYHYHYLILFFLLASFAACKKDNTNDLQENTRESQQKKANEETWTWEEEGSGTYGVWLIPPGTFDIYASMTADFSLLRTKGLPYRYYCNFCYSAVRPQPWGAVFDHSLTDPSGMLTTSYLKLGDAVSGRNVETRGIVTIIAGSGNVPYYVKANSIFYDDYHYTCQIKLRLGGQ